MDECFERFVPHLQGGMIIVKSTDDRHRSFDGRLRCLHHQRNVRVQTVQTAQLFHPSLGLVDFLGKTFASFISSIDHWIAFVLLGFIGGKMIWEAVHPEKEECEVNLPFSTILTQAIATSIDALAVGVSFALLEVNILSASVIISLTTLLCSLVGAYLGKAFGSLLKSKAEVFGGVILVLIGLKILLEHTVLA